MRKFGILFVLLLLTACNQSTSDQALPTLAEPEAIATGLVLTENAAPAGFETVSFPKIDENVEFLSGWRAELYFAFNGLYARTSRTAAASTQATIFYDQVGSRRHVIATIDNDLEESSEPSLLEGVRIGTDAWLVRNTACIQANPQDAALLADLSAGDLLGGIELAQVLPRIAVINDEQVWQYQFSAEDLVLPNLRIPEDGTGRILAMTGELWLAPDRNVVIRFIVNLDVENVYLFEQTLPVTGQISIQYNLQNIDTVPNISIPFGC